MKKILVGLLLLVSILISGCVSWAPVAPDEERPWYGLTDPNQRRGIR